MEVEVEVVDVDDVDGHHMDMDRRYIWVSGSQHTLSTAAEHHYSCRGLRIHGQKEMARSLFNTHS